MFEKEFYGDSIFNSKSELDRNKANRNKTIYLGKVVDIKDDNDARRIRVRVPELDINIIDTDLPICYPKESIFFNVYPLVGESVYVYVSDPNKPYNDRLWSGPIIRQYQYIKKDFNPEISNFNGIQDYYEKILPSTEPISLIDKSKSLYPKPGDVTINSRKNSDIRLGENEIELRAGKASRLNLNTKNEKNPGSVSLKYVENEDMTLLNLIADKINLISHGGSPSFNTNVNDKTRDDIIKNAHPLPFGDVLFEFLNIIRDALLTHEHPHFGKSALKTDAINKLKNFDLERLLSKNIKIN